MEPVCKLEFKCLTVTVLLHIVTTFRILIKSPEEGRLGCLKYQENQLSRRFFLCLFFSITVYKNFNGGATGGGFGRKEV